MKVMKKCSYYLNFQLPYAWPDSLRHIDTHAHTHTHTHTHVYISVYMWEDQRRKWCYIVHITLQGVNSAMLFVYNYAYGKEPERFQRFFSDLSVLDKTVNETCICIIM